MVMLMTSVAVVARHMVRKGETLLESLLHTLVPEGISARTFRLILLLLMLLILKSNRLIPSDVYTGISTWLQIYILSGRIL